MQPIKDTIDTIESTDNIISEEIKEVKEKLKEIIKKTSLDLLFIMDLTGSMEQFVDQVKINLNKIMDNIKKECTYADINLGFVGYKDVDEINDNENGCLNIKFTKDKDHNKVKEEINNIIVDGGDDTAEHLAWGFEKAVEMNWNSNARFSVLVTDAPCHGLKYHEKKLFDNYPQGVPNSKNIEDLVEEMANKGISLLCIKLKNDTDIMYNLFDNIYKKYTDKLNILFKIISIDSPEDLINIIIDNASNVYNNQRENDLKISLSNLSLKIFN